MTEDEFLICDKCFQNKNLQSKIEAKIKDLENNNAYWLPQDPDYNKLHWHVEVLKSLLL